MTKFFLFVFLSSLIPASLASQYSFDFNKDKPFWGINRNDASCPGPHLQSIFFKEYPNVLERACVDKESIVKLSDGGRARIIGVYFSKKNNKYQPPGFTSYSSYWYQVDCVKGKFAIAESYGVSNKGTDYYQPIAGKSGWFEFIQGERPIKLGSLTPHIIITQVSYREKLFCKKM